MMTLLISMVVLVQGGSDERTLVVYTALDRGFSEPILDAFEQKSGIDVKAVYDTESTKTVGLVNRIRAEKNRPRCDVFWNNEIVNTLRLKREGLLVACSPVRAAEYPEQFRDPERMWYGFAARARVLLVNNELVADGTAPRSLFDLVEPAWKGRIGIAKPLFGTTASHVACLFADLGEERAAGWLSGLKANGVQVMSGNKSCAQAVARGQLACGLTDTDDAIIELEAGHDVSIVYLDSKPDQLGTLFIPNTLSIIKGCDDIESAVALIDYLLSPEIEARLAAGPSAQIPLNHNFTGTVRVKTPRDIKAMPVDFSAAAEQFERAAKYIEKDFLK